MSDNGEWMASLLHWLQPQKPSDKKPVVSHDEKAKLRATRKRQRQARKR